MWFFFGYFRVASIGWWDGAPITSERIGLDRCTAAIFVRQNYRSASFVHFFLHRPNSWLNTRMLTQMYWYHSKADFPYWEGVVLLSISPKNGAQSFILDIRGEHSSSRASQLATPEDESFPIEWLGCGGVLVAVFRCVTDKLKVMNPKRNS